MRAESELHDYQRRGAHFLASHRYAGLLAGVGTGKTATALTAFVMNQLLGVSERALVVGTPAIVASVWAQEAARWEHLQHLDVVPLLGSGDRRRQLAHVDSDLTVVSFDWLSTLLNLFDHAQLPWDTLIIDELSKMKSHATIRFKRLKPRLFEFSTRWGLTGTPTPNHMLDLWSPAYLLDKDVLGGGFTKFRKKYFYPTDFEQRAWAAFPGAREEILEKASGLFHRVTLPAWQEQQPAQDNEILVPLPDRARQIYDELKAEFIVELEGKPLVAANAAVMSGKLLQIASGCLYDEQGGVHEIHDAKLEALGHLIDELQGEPLLVVYAFQHERDRVLARFPQARQLTTDPGSIAAWNANEIEVGLAHGASLGHGVNLQLGGACNLCWATPTFSSDQYEQMVGRLNRQGQVNPVTVHHLLCPGTRDQYALNVVRGKISFQQALLDELGLNQR